MISAVNDFLDDLRGGRMTEAPIVTVEQGQLQGRMVNSATGKAFYSFQGIPYARPPLGSFRFKAPQAAEPWEGVRDATSEGNVSPQIDPVLHKGYIGDENCLYLNIHTPNLDGAFLPVMVYLHGGAFKYGSGSASLYGPDYLVEKDVVVVTINYRLGALGFLSLNTPEVPGNAGLKDIVLALKWVKENIHNFGGNSGNLTLFGESCGGICTSVLTACPSTKNLINKAIMQSGNGLNHMAFQRNPLDNARKLARLLGSDAEDVDEILDFLTATTAKELVEATEKLQPLELLSENGSNFFGVMVEKEFPGVEAVLTESFHDLLTSGRVAEVPIMIGSTTLELTLERKTDDLQIFIPEDLHIERNSEEALQIANKIKSLYFKGNHTGVESLKEYFELLSDKVVNIDTHRYVKHLVKVSNKPIYYYKFDYVGELNSTKKMLSSLGLNHAGHMDELGYLFTNELLKDVEPTPQDIKMRERMTRLWTNFAKSGNPTPEENHFLTVTWLPVTSNNLYYMNLGSELSLSSNPDKEKMDFWDETYSRYFRIWEQPKTNTEEAATKTEIIVVDSVDSPEEPEVNTEVSVNNVEVETEAEVIPEPLEPEISPEVTKPEVVAALSQPEVVAVVSQPEVVAVVSQPEVKPVSTAPVIVEETVIETVIENNDKEEDQFEFPDTKPQIVDEIPAEKPAYMNGNADKKSVRTSNEIKMVSQSNGAPKDVIRANDPPEDDLPKNIGVNKFVNFFESLGGKK